MVGFQVLPLILPRVYVHTLVFREICKDTLKQYSGGFSVVISGFCLSVLLGFFKKPQHINNMALQFLSLTCCVLGISLRDRIQAVKTI